MTELLPAPVGPVRANRSSPEKSTSIRSRKGANPSIVRRSGLMSLLHQRIEQLDDSLVDRVDLVEVLDEQLVMGPASAPPPTHVLGATGRIEDHIDRLRDRLAHAVGEPRSEERRVGKECRA